jgi:hypothetical protein
MIRNLITFITLALLIPLVASSASVMVWLSGQESPRALASDAAVAKPQSSNHAKPATEDLAQSVRAGDLILMMTLTPGSAGDNELTVMYFDTDGDERAADGVRLRLSYMDYGNLSLEWAPTESHPGHVWLKGCLFPHEGNWRIEVEIQRSGLVATNASFDVRVRL